MLWKHLEQKGVEVGGDDSGRLDGLQVRACRPWH
jgi:hypothetical protein